MNQYVVDANFFIQAHRAYYPIDIVPSFWNKVKYLANNGTIISLDKVKKEIYDNEDQLKDWCEKNLPSDFFKSTEDLSLLPHYIDVTKWAAKSKQYRQSAINDFLDSERADAWLVAHSKLHGTTLVSYETPAPNSLKKIKIPDVCAVFDLQCITTISMFRELNESF